MDTTVIGPNARSCDSSARMFNIVKKRVLKPDGRIVFSFLEFQMPSHWTVFASTVKDMRGRNEHPLNVFMERNAIQAWAEHLGSPSSTCAMETKRSFHFPR